MAGGAHSALLRAPQVKTHQQRDTRRTHNSHTVLEAKNQMAEWPPTSLARQGWFRTQP